MTIAFYVAAFIALAATGMVITRLNAVHALLYLVVSLLAVALVFYVLGAPFAAALEVIIYAGAIMVLFVFVVMILNLGPEQEQQERRWLTPGIWVGPSLLAALLLAELMVLLSGHDIPRSAVDAAQVGMALYGPYILAVELASLLLLGGLVAAYHIGRRTTAQDLR
ncbi:MAG: NADH-quinone oxidoreductase subunit J [Gammaproteobacteria bacterium]|jgi:NADH-quinone oxidoreductase subunit J